MRWLVFRETEIRMNIKPSEWRRSWLVKGLTLEKKSHRDGGKESLLLRTIPW